MGNSAGVFSETCVWDKNSPSFLGVCNELKLESGERAISSPALARPVQQFRKRGFEARFSLDAIFDVQCTEKYKV